MTFELFNRLFKPREGIGGSFSKGRSVGCWEGAGTTSLGCAQERYGAVQ